jgi:hypothetical protein
MKTPATTALMLYGHGRISNRDVDWLASTGNSGLSEEFSSGVLPLITNIIFKQFENDTAQKIYFQIAETLVRSWEETGERRQQSRIPESSITDNYACFVLKSKPEVALKLWAPFIRAVESDSRELVRIVEILISAEDRIHSGETFWAIWKATVNKVLSAPDLTKNLSERSSKTKLVAALLFDGNNWKEAAREWKPIVGHERDMKDFFAAVGNAPAVPKIFIRTLNSIGAMLLPDAILWFNEKLVGQDAAKMIGDKNSLFNLSQILSALVYSRTDTLRNSQALKDATLHILNAMIEQGSSSAFRMREILLIPSSPSV